MKEYFKFYQGQITRLVAIPETIWFLECYKDSNLLNLSRKNKPALITSWGKIEYWVDDSLKCNT